jgi:uncharacterized membrane protein
MYLFIAMILMIFALILFSICFYGIYSDHQYKMKKLELIEKGFIKDIKIDFGK